MTRYAALLRAVNLGSHGKMSMRDLREIVSGLGHTDVATYIQSGNVLFDTPQKSPAKIESALEDALLEQAGLDTTVMVRTAKDLKQIVSHNPFGHKNLAPTKLVVVFLKTKPKRQGELDVSNYGPEELIIEGRELFVHYPNGQGRSKLTNAVVAREVGVPGTARNWNTVNKLVELSERPT